MQEAIWGPGAFETMAHFVSTSHSAHLGSNPDAILSSSVSRIKSCIVQPSLTQLLLRNLSLLKEFLDFRLQTLN